MNRATVFEYRTFDWTSFMPNKRRAINTNFRAALFGLGAMLALDGIGRGFRFSLGADWLIKIAGGHKPDNADDWSATPVYMRPAPMVWERHTFAALTLFTFEISLGKRNGARPYLRCFLDGRRVFKPRYTPVAAS